jgi:hypothetical protein
MEEFSMRKVLAIPALLALLAIPAVAQTAIVTSAGELDGWCKVFNRDVMPSDSIQAFNGGLCEGFISGWLQGAANITWGDDKGGVNVITIADGVFVGQLAKAFVSYMDKHSKLENKPADYALAKAIQESDLVPLPIRTSKRIPSTHAVPKVTPVSRIVVPYAPDSSGLLEVAITINGVPTDALFDTGANDVTGDFAKFGIEKTGEKKFFVATGDAKRVSTGSAVVCLDRVCLKVATDDMATDTTPLLGQSFLKLFQSVTVDRATRTITLTPGPPRIK